MPPPQGRLLDRLEERDVPVYGVGKIFDVFLGRGIRESVKTKNNSDGMVKIIEAMNSLEAGLIFVNLVDFDQQYGHRNDIKGYGAALFTADHGCDPTTPGTDHTREYVPLLVFGPRVRAVNLGLRGSLSDIGQTVAANFGADIDNGASLLEEII